MNYISFTHFLYTWAVYIHVYTYYHTSHQHDCTSYSCNDHNHSGIVFHIFHLCILKEKQKNLSKLPNSHKTIHMFIWLPLVKVKKVQMIQTGISIWSQKLHILHFLGQVYVMKNGIRTYTKYILTYFDFLLVHTRHTMKVCNDLFIMI